MDKIGGIAPTCTVRNIKFYELTEATLSNLKIVVDWLEEVYDDLEERYKELRLEKTDREIILCNAVDLILLFYQSEVIETKKLQAVGSVALIISIKLWAESTGMFFDYKDIAKLSFTNAERLKKIEKVMLMYFDYDMNTAPMTITYLTRMSCLPGSLRFESLTVDQKWIIQQVFKKYLNNLTLFFIQPEYRVSAALLKAVFNCGSRGDINPETKDLCDKVKNFK